MKIETWLPILTLALGWAGAQVTEVLRDRRASNRDRQARQAELQRTTLLELQDALLELYNLRSAADIALFEVALEDVREVPSPPAKRAAEEEARKAKDRFRDAEAKARLLISRVQDDRARRSAIMFCNAADLVLIREPSTDLELERVSKVTQAYGQATDLLGELIRERY
jgi:hypothetical protein